MGEDKALLAFSGAVSTIKVRFIERVERALSFVAREIILSTNHPDAYPFMKCRAVPDLKFEGSDELDHLGWGPLGGLAAGIEALSNCEFVAVAACDVPFLSGITLARMLDMARADESIDAVIPFTDRGPEPLVAIYRSRVARILRSALECGVRRIASNPTKRGPQLVPATFRTQALPFESLQMQSLQNSETGRNNSLATKAALDFVNILWTPADLVADDPREFLNINDPEEYNKAADSLYLAGTLQSAQISNER